MQEGDKLFRLITLLSKSEKAFITKRLKTNPNTEKNAFRLFSVYCGVREYNEAFIAKNITKHSLTPGLGKTKSQLYQFILDSLKQLNRSNTVSERISDLMADFEVLLQKGLYSDARSRLNKAKKLATDNELFSSQLNILSKESRLWPVFFSKSEKIHQLHFDNHNEQTEIEKQNNIYKIALAYFMEIMFLLSETNKRNESTLRERYRLAKDKFNLQELKRNTTVKSQILIEANDWVEACIEDNAKKFEGAALVFMKNSEAGVYEKSYRLAQILGMMNNLHVVTYLFPQFNFAPRCLDIMKSIVNRIPSKEKEDKKLGKNALLYCTLDEMLYNRLYKAGLEMMNKHISVKDITKDQVTNDPYTYYYYLGMFHFALKDYKNAIKFLNQIYLKTERDIPEYMELELTLLIILAHLELGHPDSAEYLCKDFIKLYGQHNFFAPLRIQMVEYIQKNNHLAVSKIKQELTSILEGDLDNQFFYFNLTRLNLKVWLKE